MIHDGDDDNDLYAFILENMPFKNFIKFFI